MMASITSRRQSDGQIDIGDMFDQLVDWRNESNRQFSDILEFHRIGISKGMNILVKEVFDLRAELSVIREEKGVLIQTVVVVV